MSLESTTGGIRKRTFLPMLPGRAVLSLNAPYLGMSLRLVVELVSSQPQGS